MWDMTWAGDSAAGGMLLQIADNQDEIFVILNVNSHIPITPCKMARRFSSVWANKEPYLSCHNCTLHFSVLCEALLFSP